MSIRTLLQFWVINEEVWDAQQNRTFISMRDKKVKQGWDCFNWPKTNLSCTRDSQAVIEMPEAVTEVFLDEATPTLQRFVYL